MAGAPSLKRLQIDKANSTIVGVLAVTAFVTIFALVSCKTLFSQLQYQNKIITAKQTALNQLKKDVVVNQQLVGTYNTFVSTNQNIIGGSPTNTTGANGGDNGKIVLDALPSIYDYPALTTSVQYLLGLSGTTIDSIGGTDEEATITPAGNAASTPSSDGSTTVAPGSAVAMPFQFSVDGPYTSIQTLFTNFEKSIRPIQFQNITITGDQSDLTLNATAQSYYQPAQTFNITTEAVK
jgi:hypothetical protein